jgi:hypothetical protein
MQNVSGRHVPGGLLHLPPQCQCSHMPTMDSFEHTKTDTDGRMAGLKDKLRHLQFDTGGFLNRECILVA